ncbi:TPA: 7-carboxy-7-deazaguanine synthase QueE [Clostridioides difficile]|uniref:7-carboxy-7-deazaguanine synthase QueE n=1 Tax=Clostridioides difficile TaxID=1496 RepID=UPI00038DB8FA|nr:7-carboxy-7-deazaguanine synthase QueE [Clostridioides difficile]EGT4019438.1 7-carboxy-7-deazaguanine synthase QueE [Clostridioides difficile]EGT4186479.1 7-carboxy-7-deazaguanine synthase QueE [Clostridioides difficile]EGT4218126.1 7-carboxy-7-deazaguanine synthase QueE [Clostridioides difficile]EGT5475260.1 7-carboxy-7-deazaguanine synthase QueE [Clostridioides difficile]EJA6850499.1 7-carboxy-7-deazaguanine synthase QueE [Clostridioides difficile]
MLYNVCQDGIFKSVQGEGKNAGRSTVFIRLSGCNMIPKCTFCDEDFENCVQMDVESILKEIQKLEPFSMIVITGGEPTIQDLEQLIFKLKQKRYYISIETNGINNNIPKCDWITCSPKTLNIKIAYANELKFVINKKKDETVNFINTILKEVRYDYICLQPESNKEECILTCLELINENPNFNLSLQQHKFINIK